MIDFASPKNGHNITDFAFVKPFELFDYFLHLF